MQIDRKHILLITTSFPRETPGQEAAGGFVYEIARHLSESLKVTVVAPGNTVCREQFGDITVYRYRAPEQALSALKLSSPKGFYWTGKVMWEGYAAAKRALNQESQICYILAFWVIPSGLWAWFAGRSMNIPFASWALGSDIWSYRRNPVTRFILKKVLAKSDRCYADGFELSEEVKDIGKVSCKMIPSARLKTPEISRKRQAEAPYKLVFVGRWHTNKGVDLLLEALLGLSDNDWERIEAVCIAGGGPLESLVKQKVVELQSNNRPVECRGYVAKEALDQLFQWADFYLLPSRIESIPVILSDGVANQIPVIATPAGDLKMLCEKFDLGWVARSVSAEDYKTLIATVLDAENSTQKMDAQGFFDLFDQDKSIEEIRQRVQLM